jgi:hypothetical protein
METNPDLSAPRAQAQPARAPAELEQRAPGGSVPRATVLAATELQDHLLVATNDLDRLQRLLEDASQALVGHFHGAAGQMKAMLREAARRPEIDSAPLNAAMDHLAAAITSLQFQDMASQLLTHTHRRLRGCADRLAAEAMELDEDEAAFLDTVPMQPNPVTQDEMDAGSVELF